MIHGRLFNSKVCPSEYGDGGATVTTCLSQIGYRKDPLRRGNVCTDNLMIMTKCMHGQTCMHGQLDEYGHVYVCTDNSMITNKIGSKRRGAMLDLLGRGVEPVSKVDHMP